MLTSRKRIFLPLIIAAAIATRGFAFSSLLHPEPREDKVEAGADSTAYAADTAAKIPPQATGQVLQPLSPEDSLWEYSDSILYICREDIDTTFHMLSVNDSLRQIVDSALRAAFVRDSTEQARIAFQHWFDSIPKKEQKRWIHENVIIPRKIHESDSILALKDSLKAIRDSITENTPRILETPYIPDSLYYKRLLYMTRDMEVGNIKQEKFDTSYNYHYYDYPFFRQDVNATWLGVAGSPVQTYNVYTRKEEENAIFFTPYKSWSESPDDTPMYNTKTPYTELAYWGTLLSGDKKEELNVHVLTTQNITPRLNLTLGAEKYGGNGQMQNSTTSTKNFKVTMNYLGKSYAVHAGWLSTMVSRTESGGFRDNTMIRDTTLDSKEIDVNLASATNAIRKNTGFINQSWRISFGNDSLTTAYIGHTLDFSDYYKHYTDKISDEYGKRFYNDVFILDPTSSSDTMRVSKLDNKVFIRLQPWKEGSIVSKIDAGIGDKLLFYSDYIKGDDFTGLKTTTLNNLYAYGGARGMFRKYFDWNARCRFYFAGYQAGDFDVDAALTFKFYPFRRQRNSPLAIGVNFHTDLTRPDHYQNYLMANHFSWNNDFNRQSTTRIGGVIDIPYWKLKLSLGYSLLANKLYYNEKAIVSQSGTPVNVLYADLQKEFVIWKFHLDNHLLVQYSSDQAVMPVPLFSMNLRYFIEFDVVKRVMKMQLGAQCTLDTEWYMPDYNPEVGTFFNQNVYSYGNCPYIDVFLNIQWKRCCIFVKLENANQGWPCNRKDYFTANNYIHTQRGVKFGVFWPFYIQPAHKHSHSHDGGQVGSGARGVQKSGNN